MYNSSLSSLYTAATPLRNDGFTALAASTMSHSICLLVSHTSIVSKSGMNGSASLLLLPPYAIKHLFRCDERTAMLTAGGSVYADVLAVTICCQKRTCAVVVAVDEREDEDGVDELD